MGSSKFYFPLDNIQNQKKTEFVAVRLQRDLFLQLKAKAKENNSDLSNTIRKVIEESINK